MLGKTEGRRRRGRQDEMVGWHQQLNGHELEQTPGVDDGQGSLACYSPWGQKESDTTEGLNNNNKVKTKNTSSRKWVSKVWCIYSIKYNSALKRKNYRYMQQHK